MALLNPFTRPQRGSTTTPFLSGAGGLMGKIGNYVSSTPAGKAVIGVNNTLTQGANALGNKLNTAGSNLVKSTGNLLGYAGSNIAQQFVPQGGSTYNQIQSSKQGYLQGFQNAQPGQSLGAKAVDPNASIQPAKTTLATKDMAPSVAGYYRQGNDVYDAQGNYISFAEAQKRGIVPLLTSIPQKATSSATPPTESTTIPPSTSPGAGQPVGGALGGTQAGTQDGVNGSTQAAGQQNQGGLYGNLIGALAATPFTNRNVQKATQDLADFQRGLAKTYAGIESTPIPLEFQQGREQVVGRQAASEQAALQSAVSNALQAQGQQISALQGAAGLAQPVSQFGMLTNPITGTPLNTQVFQSAIAQAQQLVNNGVPANDPSVQQLLSPFGFVGPLAFNQAQQALTGGNWNPAAQSAAAGQNISAATNFQQQAVALDTGLKNMRTISPLVTQAAAQVGINPTDATLYNAPINSYIAQIRNSGGFANFQAMINDIQRYSSQIISSGADLTPTGVTAATALMSPQNLSVPQIQSYLATLDQLGTNQLAVLQQQARAAGGSSAGYYGNPANITSGYTAPQSNAYGGNVTSPLGQFGAGVGLSALGQLENIGAQVLSFIGGMFAK